MFHFFPRLFFPPNRKVWKYTLKRRKKASPFPEILVQAGEISTKRAKLILKLSTLAKSLLCRTGKFAFSSEMQCTEMAAFSWHLLWGQRGSSGLGILMLILRQSVQLVDCTARRKVSIKFLLCGVWGVGTLEPRVQLPDAQTTCLSWHTGKHCSSVKNWHLLLPPFGPDWEPYCDP